MGILVGIGVDGDASNDSENILAELRTTIMVHRIKGVHQGVTPADWYQAEQVFDMAIRDGAILKVREQALGSIEVGKMADLIAVELNQIGFSSGSVDPLCTLLFCGFDFRVNLFLINGKILFCDGTLLNIDQGDLAEQANRVTEQLITKVSGVTGLNYA